MAPRAAGVATRGRAGAESHRPAVERAAIARQAGPPRVPDPAACGSGRCYVGLRRPRMSAGDVTHRKSPRLRRGGLRSRSPPVAGRIIGPSRVARLARPARRTRGHSVVPRGQPVPLDPAQCRVDRPLRNGRSGGLRVAGDRGGDVEAARIPARQDSQHEVAKSRLGHPCTQLIPSARRRCCRLYLETLGNSARRVKRAKCTRGRDQR